MQLNDKSEHWPPESSDKPSFHSPPKPTRISTPSSRNLSSFTTHNSHIAPGSKVENILENVELTKVKVF